MHVRLIKAPSFQVLGMACITLKQLELLHTVLSYASILLVRKKCSLARSLKFLFVF